MTARRNNMNIMMRFKDAYGCYRQGVEMIPYVEKKDMLRHKAIMAHAGLRMLFYKTLLHFTTEP